MEGSVKISPAEFNMHLFEKLQMMFQTIGPKEIVISFSDTIKETKQETERRLLDAREDIQNGKGQTFTMEELEAYLKA